MKHGRFYEACLLSVALLAGCSSMPKEENREPANMGGFNYNQGTYGCVTNPQAEATLQAHFTFGASTADLTINGTPIALSCEVVQKADANLAQIFRQAYIQPADICTGRYSKGNVAVATSNSMGAVQMTALLLDSAGNPKMKSVLNCKSEAPKKNDGW